MKRVLDVIMGRWFLSFVGAAAAAVLLWLLGPLSPLLESETARLAGVAVILLVWLVANLLIGALARRADRRMIARIAEAPSDQESAARQAASEEVGLLRERLEEALDLLRRSSRGSRWRGQYLYELPWYMLIGPPGSGKTTALRNSGLNFPLSEKFGRDPLRGVGGTRNCDWWLSEGAVLLDTAGRYTTQDSDQAVDQKAWDGFLDLLKTFRPRQPINGAIVAIGLSDLALMGGAERDAHARAIRARLKELREHFGVRFPVYVMLSKLDLAAGFVEFFDDLDRGEREQVWGTTFALEAESDQAGAIADFEAGFDTLLKRLNERLLQRLSDERDPTRRALIFGFPAQLASLKRPLAEFLGAVFAPSRYEERPLLRGVYFTSATQEGTPVDRLMAAIAQSFAMERQQLPAFSGAGRGYFLTDLFKELIFGEASLVQSDPRRERRRRWRQRAAYGALALVCLAVAGAWTWSFLGNRTLVADTDAAAAKYGTTVRPLEARQVDDDDVARILPALDAARALPTGYQDRTRSVPVGLTFGLYQGDKLGSEAVLAYRRALDGLLLPRLIVGVHNQLAATRDNPDLVNLLLQVYLMLGQQGPMNRDLVKRAVEVIWGGRTYPGRDATAARADIDAHLDALLSYPMDAIPLDAQLLAQARAVVARAPLPARAYRAVADSAAAQALPVWRVVDHAGPAADQLVIRASGKPLTDGVPGLYTRDGFRKVMLVQAPLAVKAVADQTWVLGPQYKVSLTGDRLQSLVGETLDLYFKDYIRQWDALLADIRVAPFTSLDGARDAINTLSGPASPLRWLLTSAAEETTLVEPAPTTAAGKAGQALQAAQTALASPAQALNALAASTGTTVAPPPGKAVDDHFKPLHDAIAGIAAGQSQVDDAMRRLAALGTALSAQAANPGAALAGQGGAGTESAALAASQLAQLGARLPAPAAGIVAAVASGSTAIATGNARKAVNELYLSAVLPACRQALQGRYPIDRTSAVDVSLADFAAMFRPGGVIDGFFNTSLKPYVDTSRSPWRNQKVDNTDLGLSKEALAQFERARAIRDAFFPAGGQTPSAAFVVEPVSLSPKAAQVVLDLDGKAITYAHGPAIPTSLAWPAPDGATVARLSFTSLAGGATPAVTTEGAWAWFRLLDRARVDGALPDQFTAEFTLGGLSGSFRVRAASVHNPFRDSDLSHFRCPGAL